MQNKNRLRLSSGRLTRCKNEQERSPYSSQVKVAQFPSPEIGMQAIHTHQLR